MNSPEFPREPDPRPQSVEIASSVMNLFDKSTLYTAFWPVHAFADTIQEAGYAGLEWHPVRLAGGVQLMAGLVSEDTKDAIRSLHQSWRSEKSIGEVFRHPNRALAAVSYVLLPERIASLDALERLQHVLGRQMPVVLYPSEPHELSGTDRPFGEKLFQPGAEIMEKWHIDSVDGLMIEAKRRGFTGFALDLFILRVIGKQGTRFPAWQDALRQLLSFTQEIHVSAGRVDIPAPNIDTIQELRELLAGKGNSELLQMLRTIASSGWRGRIVTEIPAIALASLRRERGPHASFNNLIEDHKQVVSTIQTIFA